MRHFYYFFSHKHTFACAQLPPVTHPPTPRIYVSPTSRSHVNEQKYSWESSQGSPSPPWPSITTAYSTSCYVLVILLLKSCRLASLEGPALSWVVVVVSPLIVDFRCLAPSQPESTPPYDRPCIAHYRSLLGRAQSRPLPDGMADVGQMWKLYLSLIHI